MGTNIAALSQFQQTMAASESSKTGEQAKDQVSKDMFLKLFVAQIKNQDPLKPQDGVEFLSQLAQFTNLEQMIGIRNELEAIHTAIETPKTTGETTS